MGRPGHPGDEGLALRRVRLTQPGGLSYTSPARAAAHQITCSTGGFVEGSWGEQEFQPGETKYWQIGPRDLWVTLADNEWLVASRLLRDESDRVSLPPRRSEKPPEDPSIQLRRVTAAGQSSRARLLPALPDRPLVVRPVVPIFIPPSTSATLYVSTPLWLRLSLGDDATPVLDEAIFRPSDTWFGESTTQGTLCYASRSSARLRIDDLPPLGHRAMGLIRVENRRSKILEVERMSVPVPELSLWVDAGGQLWVDRLTLRQDDRTGATVSVSSGEGLSSALTMIAEPRARRSKGTLFEAFTGLTTGYGDSV